MLHPLARPASDGGAFWPKGTESDPAAGTSSHAAESGEGLEEWSSRLLDVAQRAIGMGTAPDLFQQQAAGRFLTGLEDAELASRC